MNVVGRRVATVLSIAGLVGFALAPRVHVHRGHAEEGHQARIVHQHFDAHRFGKTANRVIHDDDDVVLWLDAAYIGPEPSPQTFPDNRCLAEVRADQELATSCRLTLPVVYASVHDPPSSTSHGLRAPPFPAA